MLLKLTASFFDFLTNSSYFFNTLNAHDFIAVFAAPLDGLGDVPFGGDFSVRCVGVDRPQVTGFPEDFRDVPGQIPPVGVPGAVFVDGQRARSLRLRRVPEQEPPEDSADGIYGGYLQVATIHVAQRPIDALFAGVPPAHVVVGAFHHGIGAFIDEAHRAVFRVVGDLPDSCRYLDSWHPNTNRPAIK